MNTPKAGIKTTEFWLAAILATVGPAITILVALGYTRADNAPVVSETITSNADSVVKCVGIIVANITAILGLGKYIQSRTDIKKDAGNLSQEKLT